MDIRAMTITILEISSRLHQVSFNHITRQFNTFADVVAKLYLRDLLPPDWQLYQLKDLIVLL